MLSLTSDSFAPPLFAVAGSTRLPLRSANQRLMLTWTVSVVAELPTVSGGSKASSSDALGVPL